MLQIYWSQTKREHEARYDTFRNKYRTRSCNAKNINVNEIETFAVQHLKAYFLGTDFEKMAKMIVAQINNASPNLEGKVATFVFAKAN